MKIFAMHDEFGDPTKDLAFLEYYEREEAFFFELPPDADPWELPFILHEFASRGKLSVDAFWSKRWVQSRLVPPERQNLGEVLRENGLDRYSEFGLLELTGGRCSQDECYLVSMSLERMPAWYWERVDLRAVDAVALPGFRILLMLGDGTTMLCKPKEVLAGKKAFSRVLTEEERFMRLFLQPGGHGVQWGEDLFMAVDELRETGDVLSLSTDDLVHLVDQVVCDTSEVARLLDCSRQNVSDLVRRGRLAPIKTTARGALFLRADILQRRWM